MKKLKLFFACLLMAVLSIGQVWAAENDTHDFEQSVSELLNNCNVPDDIVIAEQSYSVKEVIITYSYNKSAPATASVQIGSTAFGTSVSLVSAQTSASFSGDALKGAITISFEANSGCNGTKKGTLGITNVRLVEGPASGGDPVDPTITFNNGSVDAGYTLDLSTLFTSNSTGAVTYSITEGGSYATIDGSILTGVTAGSVTVQASQVATASYNAATANSTITVNAHTVTPGKYDILFANAFWGTSGTGANAGHTASGIQNDIAVSINGNSGTQNYINGTETRIYGSHTLTFSVPTGYVLTEITGLGTADKSSISVASGSTGSIATRVWTGSANSVTFDIGGRTDFSTVSVTFALASSSPEVSVSPELWDFGTVHAGDAASKVFSVSGSNLTAGDLTLTAPAGFSVSPSSIAVDGTLEATEVTVSKNTSTVNDYSGNLEITGGGLASAKTVALTMSVDADPAPTGTFKKFTGDLTAGKYVICDGTNAMKNTATSAPRIEAATVTVNAEDKIVNPDANVVWNVEFLTGDDAAYFTLYNEDASKYAAFTSTNARGTVVDAVTDYAKWQYSEKEFSNKGLSGKYLRFNDGYGFASYATTTGNQLTLYKLDDGTPNPPTFSPAGGLFLEAQSVTLSAEAGAEIYYTMGENPADPTSGSTHYTGAIAVSSTTTIKAIAIKDEKNSGVATATYTIVATEHAGTEADPYSVADAKIVIDAVGTKENAYVSGIVSSIYSTSLEAGGAISFYISADGATSGQQLEAYKCLSLNSEAFTALSDVETGATVVITGTLKKFSSTYEFDQNCHLVSYEAPVAPKQSIANDQDHPYTVAQALVYAADGVTYDLDDYVYVRGVVYDVANFNNGAMNIFIKDADAENSFELYKCAGINDGSATTPFEALTDVQAGDIVIGYGQLTVFNSVSEFKQGNYLVDLDRPAVAVTGVELASTASVAIGKTINLSANVLPANATDKAIAWSIVSGNDKITLDNGAVTGVAEGTAVVRATAHGDNTKYADCTITVEELSVWATTYTNNVVVAHTGSGEDNGTITIGTDDPYKLVKAGASSNTGTIVVTVPVGTTDLHFHAFAWGGKTAKIQISGVTNPSVSEFDLEGEAGASGSGNDFTLQGDPVDQYFHVSFDAVAAETEITFSKATGSADNRFFFYGVNQEGGLVLESIAISGTATELVYTDGQHFNPAGLSVTGHYSDASTAPITEGIVWAFDPDPLTQGTTSVSVTATAGGFTSDPFVVNGLTVSGAAPLSPWATTYTSNVTLSDATESTVIINETEYDAMKAGTGSAAGSVNVAIPAQATTLHFHASGWDGKEVTLNLTAPSGITITPASVNLTADAGVSGSGTTYTLANNPSTTAYFAVTLSGNTDAFTLNIANTGSKKQFVLYGVNQEGGVLPVLQSIAISGNVTKKSGYKVGDKIDHDGLTVMATSTLGDVPQTPEDVTAKVAWSHAALVEGQTEVTLTASYGGKTDNIVITLDEAVASADPNIYVSTLNVNFASVEVGGDVPAAQTVTVTLTNVAAATATLGGTNPEAFSIDKTALVDGDVITISVIASTAAAASYSATITITDNAAAATEKVVNLSFAVTEPAVEETPVSTTSKWVPATAIEDGMQVLITGVKSGVTYAMGGQNKNNRAAVAASVDGEDVLTPGENTMSFTLVAQETEGVFALRTSNGKYLYAAASGENHMKTQDEVDVNAKWTMTVASASAEGSSNRHVMQFNTGSTLFSCYASAGGSGMAAIKLYVPKPETPEPPTPVYTEVRNGLTEGWYYTMCLDKAVTAVKAGSIWRVLSKAANGNDVILEEAELPLVAGRPYIFRAAASTLEVAYTGDAVLAPVNDDDNNGLFGSFEKASIAADANNYIIYNNELYLVNTANVYVGEHRAYLNMSKVPAFDNGAGAPGRLRMVMKVNGKGSPQGFESIEASEKPMKLMINGKIYILRGEKMYDATGRLVK